MSRVFVSYRHTEPDEGLAAVLLERLESDGHQVFLDTKIPVGKRWAEEIEREIVKADFFVVLLSEESLCSDMVRQEVKMAHDLNRRSRKPVVLPVRVAFEGELPYDLGAYLDPIQYVAWQEGVGVEGVAGAIAAAIEDPLLVLERGKAGDEYTPEGVAALARATEHRGAPLPVADPRFALETGTVWLDSPFYVRRRSDSEMEEHLKLVGSTIIVRGARQMGKSSLLARASVGDAYQPLYIDFQLMAEQNLRDLDSLFRYIAHRFAKLANTGGRPDDYWDDKAGPIDSVTNFMEEAILGDAEPPVLLLFDEADMIFKCAYKDQFFSAVRAWHNSRATSSAWKRLSLIIAHSTDPYLWIQDINRSPFNVGYAIKLEEFDFSEICSLNSKYASPLKTDAEISQLIRLVGGQPYLTRQALYQLSINRWSISQLENVADDEDGPFGDHLHRFLWSLQKEPQLKKALRQVMRRRSCDSEQSFQRLKAAGLIKGDVRRHASVRCRLYQKYFEKHL